MTGGEKKRWFSAVHLFWYDLTWAHAQYSLANINFQIGSVIQTAAYHISMLIIGRIITGFGVGSLTVTVPVYQVRRFFHHPSIKQPFSPGYLLKLTYNKTGGNSTYEMAGDNRRLSTTDAGNWNNVCQL